VKTGEIVVLAIVVFMFSGCYEAKDKGSDGPSDMAIIKEQVFKPEQEAGRTFFCSRAPSNPELVAGLARALVAASRSILILEGRPIPYTHLS